MFAINAQNPFLEGGVKIMSPCHHESIETLIINITNYNDSARWQSHLNSITKTGIYTRNGIWFVKLVDILPASKGKDSYS